VEHVACTGEIRNKIILVTEPEGKRLERSRDRWENYKIGYK
jgi:hypothetical protein